MRERERERVSELGRFKNLKEEKHSVEIFTFGVFIFECGTTVCRFFNAIIFLSHQTAA